MQFHRKCYSLTSAVAATRSKVVATGAVVRRAFGRLRILALEILAHLVNADRRVTVSGSQWIATDAVLCASCIFSQRPFIQER